jgi:hypothetical protein
MKCHEVQDALGLYWDLPEGDTLRLSVDLHLEHCIACKEEFRIWEESELLIRQLAAEDEAECWEPSEAVNRQVMMRIYAEDGWMASKPRAFHPLGRHLGNRLSAAVAACLAMFTTSLLYVLLSRGADDPEAVRRTGLMETANAASGSMFKVSFSANTPVAQASDPFILYIVPTTPQYWIVLSMLGLVLILFMLNWLSRIRK